MNNNGIYMTKMDMVWIAVASCIYPDVRSGRTVSKKAIDDKVKQLFGVKISPAMINQHLVGSVDRQARKGGYGGGSRNRYLSKGENGEFRLYKNVDSAHDGRDKDGPWCPSKKDIIDQYRYLVAWYEQSYRNTS